MKNILDGKYIILNKKNYSYFLSILYNMNYYWEEDDPINPKHHSDLLDIYEFNLLDKIYVYSIGKRLSWWYNNNIDDDIERTQLNVNVLLRQYKLKRILK